MKLTKTQKIGYAVIQTIKTLIILGLIYLERLSYQKAGVNHHLRFRKTYIVKNYLTNVNVTICVVICILIALYFIYKYFKQQQNSPIVMKLILIGPIFWSITLVLSLTTDVLSKLRAYPYFVFGILVILVLSILINLLFKNNQSKSVIN